MFAVQFFMFSIISLWSASSIVAQPDNAIEIYLLKGNKLFQQGLFEEALINYRELIARQPSNNYVIEQIARADEELLYEKITKNESPEAECRLYINKYGEDGKYIKNVKNLLGEKFLAEAYKDYQKKNLEALANLYVDYNSLLGAERSGEMKKWLYLLCNEEAKSSLKSKDWSNAKEYFERSLKYANNDEEFKDAQRGIARALKKKS